MSYQPPTHVDAPVYLQIEPEFSRYNDDTVNSVRAARVVAMTQKRPQQPRRGVVVIKVLLRIPKAAFVPLRPEAIVIVPESMTEAVPVEVEAVHPGSDA